MALSWLLGFTPQWVILDNTGRPAAGAKLYTYDSLDHDQLKAAYQDPAGNDPWTNPIVFNANGVQGPIYFQFDSSNPNDNYYLRAYDANGNFLWAQDNFTGASGSGGGGVVTDNVDIANLITNPIFWYPTQPLNTQIVTANNVLLAPGAHDGFVSGANTNGYTGPDISFNKNNTNATDYLEFISFPEGDTSLSPDITPPYYLRYNCSVLGAGETYKYVQYPITPKVQNLTNSACTAVIYARCTAGNATLQLYIRQYFGDGPSATPETFPFHPFGAPITLTNVWTQYPVKDTVPSVTGKVIGECGNDALYLCVGYPLSQTTTIDHVKVAFYPDESFAPDVEFITMDQIDAVTMTPRVGDIKTSLWGTTPFGYLPMNDTSIGSASSGATNRANTDTFALYSLIWNAVSNTWAPVSGGRGASAQADFAANKTLTLPLSLGRALAGAGAGAGLTSRALGQSLGEETHTLITNEIPSHTHTVPATNAGAGFNTTGFVLNGGIQNLTSGATGGGAAHNNMQPTSFFNVFIKY